MGKLSEPIGIGTMELKNKIAPAFCGELYEG